jgi:hypothetical protein
MHPRPDGRFGCILNSFEVFNLSKNKTRPASISGRVGLFLCAASLWEAVRLQHVSGSSVSIYLPHHSDLLAGVRTLFRGFMQYEVDYDLT